MGRNSNNSLNNINPITPTIVESPTSVKSDTNNFSSTISPTSIFNIDKQLPEIPKNNYLNTESLNKNSKFLKRFKSTPFIGKSDKMTLQKNVSELNLTNVESQQRNKISGSFLKLVKPIPNLNKGYNNNISKYLDEFWSVTIDINEKNEIVLPSNIRPLNSKHLQSNFNELNETLTKKVNPLLNGITQSELDDKIKNKFWINYKGRNSKSIGFIFVEKIRKDFTEYYSYEFIGANNKFELVSYLNNDIPKTDNIYNQRNIDMKYTLKRNIEDENLLTFDFWCTILNKEYLKK